MKFSCSVTVGDKLISAASPTFIIAEAGVNHGGDINLAKKLVNVAAEAGADAVKFQAFKTESLILSDVEKAPYQRATTNASESQFNMLKKLEISQEQTLELKNYCEQKKILFLTTPFDEPSLDSLDDLDLPAYKVASTDITNLPFLQKIAQKKKPIFLSTGMSYFSEVEKALAAIAPINDQVVLLQCTANYPIEDDEANLSVLNTYQQHFDMLLGYSDHTRGLGASPFAIPMGAKVVEKHFTLDGSLEGPDHSASLLPHELKDYVALVRKVDRFMGSSIKMPTLSELKTRQSLQKCLVAREPIAKGEAFSTQNLIAMRTGGEGLSPIYFDEVVGQIASKDFNQHEIISL